MKKYLVTFTHVIERHVSAIIEADSEEEAIEKAHTGEFEISDEDCAPEEGILIKDEEAREVSDKEAEELFE